MWLQTVQNAFLTETNPATGVKWPDRYGKAFGKGFSKTGNIEPYLAYKKLQRTGRLLRGIRAKHFAHRVILSSSAPYTTEHQFGRARSAGAIIRPPYAQGGASGVVTGGRIHARPFMRPSKQILRAPKRLIEEQMKKFGWR